MSKTEIYSVRKEIMDSVMRLMSEKDYCDITVTDIINRSGVARASFYRNFSSVSDVIDAVVDDLTEEMMEDAYSVFRDTDERKWRAFLFSHFYRFVRIKKKMEEIGTENMSVLFTRMNDLLMKKESAMPHETIREKYIASVKWGIISSVIEKWIETGSEETPEEMIDYIMSFITTF